MSNDFGFKMKEGFAPLEETKEETAETTAETTETEATEETKEEEKVAETTESTETSTEQSESGSIEKEETETKVEETTDIKAETKEEEAKETKSSLNKIAELTKDQFKTEEELYEAYSSLKKVDGKTLMESINEQVREKYGDESLTFADLVAVKNIDYNSMNELDLIREYLEFEDPEITDVEIKAEMYEFDLMKKSKAEIQEMIEDEKITQSQYDHIEAKMVSRARKAKKALTEYQASINLDEFELHVPGQPAIDPTPQKSEEEIKKELAEYNATIDSLAELQVNVGTKENPVHVNIKVTDEDRNGIKDFCEKQDGKNFIDKRWLGDDGRVKMDVLSKDIYKILNYDRDVAVGFTQGKSEGLKEAIKDNDNINLKDKSSGQAHVDTGNIHAKIAKEIN